MKITKRQLRRIIREEKARMINEWEAYTPTSEEHAVIERIDDLNAAIAAMGSSNSEMTDHYVGLFRALEAAGVNVKQVAAFA